MRYTAPADRCAQVARGWFVHMMDYFGCTWARSVPVLKSVRLALWSVHRSSRTVHVLLTLQGCAENNTDAPHRRYFLCLVREMLWQREAVCPKGSVMATIGEYFL